MLNLWGWGRHLPSFPHLFQGTWLIRMFISLSLEGLGYLTREDLESTLCFPLWRSTVIKHLLYVLSLWVLWYQSKFSITTVGLHCDLFILWKWKQYKSNTSFGLKPACQGGGRDHHTQRVGIMERRYMWALMWDTTTYHLGMLDEVIRLLGILFLLSTNWECFQFLYS